MQIRNKDIALKKDKKYLEPIFILSAAICFMFFYMHRLNYTSPTKVSFGMIYGCFYLLCYVFGLYLHLYVLWVL